MDLIHYSSSSNETTQFTQECYRKRIRTEGNRITFPWEGFGEDTPRSTDTHRLSTNEEGDLFFMYSRLSHGVRSFLLSKRVYIHFSYESFFWWKKLEMNE